MVWQKDDYALRALVVQGDLLSAICRKRNLPAIADKNDEIRKEKAEASRGFRQRSRTDRVSRKRLESSKGE